ncbi:hypothetical protein UFOVP1492_18 [uncultured Caudovirales phage]|uniref:Uncharacterized protein n=1 Tax=uncultured Caudovirales phage TaxID=2100421 RepID=A0A6J5RMU9_9CAUD|nr:hypothetical protein UFOVP1127_116 [uncultured Caudovirales phage]CAB4193515.1 hypothetical protein UFOVP1242_94 [uncultured Caudovirales phage]CAB4217265.1 hypothetical protein UFOVP1492_18 [uncultured Caudovirales phage]CAB5231267.1 hypothetical protein UFOVP1580_47 [uncultured Caudovirales phage]
MKNIKLPLTPIQQVLLEKALEIYKAAVNQEVFHERAVVTKGYLISEIEAI